MGTARRRALAGTARSEAPVLARGFPPHWPLTVLLFGFPLWWVLGLTAVIPVLAAGAMFDQLVRGRRFRVPPGFPLWLLFLAWVMLGVLMLGVDAPGAVPGGADAGRLMVFGYRAVWYLTVTVVLLWVGNLAESELPGRHLRQCFAFMFLVTAAGGLLGVVVPTLEFPSALELALPRSVAGDAFVQSLIHPDVADVQTVLGDPEPRPKAPFAFANSWGSNFAVYLPFFLMAWWREGRRWQRAATPLVLAVGLVPVVHSLNRGLWLTLGLGALLGLLLLARRGAARAVLVAASALVVVAVVLAAGPLGEVLSERIENPHSNDRRSQLIQQTVASAVEGSPVLGFGTTRDVQGSFASIAGGATPDCEACAVPPLGTQGHLWMVVFSQGLVGAVLFLAFLLCSLWLARGARTPAEVVGLFVLLFLLVQLVVYDTLGMPLLAAMAAAALMWRERRQGGSPGEPAAGSTLPVIRRSVRGRGRWFVVLPLLGALVAGSLGWVLSSASYASRVSVLLAPTPVALDGEDAATAAERYVTVDTEAALVVAERSLARVVDSPEEAADLRARIRVSAPPNTTVLRIEVRARDPETASRTAREVASAYLVNRAGHLDARRKQTISLVRDRLDQLADDSAAAVVVEPGDPAPRAELQAALEYLVTTPTDPGDVIEQSTLGRQRRALEVPIVSGGALGLATAFLLALTVPPRIVARTRRTR